MESSNTLDQSLEQNQIWYAGTITKKGKINSVAQTSPRRSGFAPLFNQWECPLCAKDVTKQQRSLGTVKGLVRHWVSHILYGPKSTNL